MNNQKDEHQKSEKPQYIKPEVVATYSKQELEKEFANVYGQSGGGGGGGGNNFVDLFGP
jgi:hypothetical protein